MKFSALPLVALLTLASPLAQLAIGEDCSPKEVPGKHGTPNNYRVAFNGDGHGKDISHSIWVYFKMFDDGRIEAPLKYDNDSKEPFCGGVHIRLGDINNNSIAEFYSDPSRCVDGRPLISIGGGPIERTYDWTLQTTPEVACKYAHLSIVPNHDHPETSSASLLPAGPSNFVNYGVLAQAKQCTCLGATRSTKEIGCKGPDGKEVKKTQVCWTRKVIGTNEDCGTVCDSAYTVCDGTATGTCN